ncbi:MAG: PspC domain-containing protein [Micromonosporaceae bacterium]|nr:PspC domain-containing protein [Micromonosporaceae bacterium]
MPLVAAAGGATAAGAYASRVATERPRLYREPDGRLVAGVAVGIARHLRVPVIWVRLGFTALALVGGLGALLYAAYWAVVPIDPNRSGERGRRDTVQLVAFGSLAVGIQLVALMSGLGGIQDAFGWLVALIAVGAGIIWHQADPQRRLQWSEMVPGMPRLARHLGADRYGFGVRLAIGAVLVLVGIVGMIAVFSPLANAGLSSLVNGLLFTVIALGGLAVVAGPLAWGMIGQLRQEREARIRERERAEVAAMVHDQVLHTLALIRRNSGDELEVARLARSQERSLRNWLYKPAGSSAERFAAALEEAAAEVENEFSVSVDSVVVGDCAVDPHVAALVAAAREAMVNAAKHSGERTLSLYAEVEPGQISVFVRDRGSGFDLADVDGDRHGVRGSIIGRMRRHGGEAEVRTGPGEGCEVRLTLPIEERERA